MAKKTSENPITSFEQPWDKNPKDKLPQSGKQMREFLGEKYNETKEALAKKVGFRYEDSANNRYLYFASEEDAQLYTSDPDTYGNLLMWADAMQADYKAEIYVPSDMVSRSFLLEETGVAFAYTFDILNKQGTSAGDSVLATYTITNGNGKKSQVNEIYAAGTKVNFLLDTYLSEGENRVTVQLRGRSTLAGVSASIIVNMVNLQLTSEFDITKAYAPGEAVSFNIHTTGVGNKYLEILLDGNDVATPEDMMAITPATMLKKLVLSDELEAGRHTLQIRAFITAGAVRYYSRTLYYDFAVSGGTDVLVLMQSELPVGTVVSDTLTLKAEQYKQTTFQYAVYDPRSREQSVIIKQGKTTIAQQTTRNGLLNSVSYTPSDSGEQTITIGETYSFTLSVAQSTSGFLKATEGLAYEFLAKGRSNTDSDKSVWQSGDATVKFQGVSFNQQSGWIGDENGDVAMVLSGGATMEIPVKPLEKNVADTGVTIELDYRVDNGNADDDTVLLDLMNKNNEGVRITPIKVEVKADNGTKGFDHLTMTGVRRKLAVIVYRKSNTETNRTMFLTVCDGKTSYAANYTTSAPMKSTSTMVFGDSTGTATIRIYGLRIYTRALSIDECLANYAIDSGQVVTIANRNDVYVQGTSQLSYEKTRTKVESFNIIGDLSVILQSTKKETIFATVEHYNPDNINDCWTATNVKVKTQGNSTLKYPVKNLSLDFTAATFTDIMGAEMESQGLRISQNSYPLLRFVCKADYMESSCSFNTAGARSFNDTGFNTQIDGEYKLRTKAQQLAAENGHPYDVRTAIDGKTVVIFSQPTSSGDMFCMGVFDFNNGKDDCPEAYGFQALDGYDSSKTERWELLEENDMCVFSPTFATEENFAANYAKYFECIFGKGDPAALKKFYFWLASCVKSDGELDVDKFDETCEQHLDLWKTAHYYNHIFVKNIGVDQPAKNMHLVTEDGDIWFPVYYDGDSAKLNDNDGFQFLDLYADRQSKDANGNWYFEGHDSVLWNLCEASSKMMNIIKREIAAESATTFNYAGEVEQYITRHIAKLPERIVNQNAEYKYFRTFRNLDYPTAGSYLYVSQGTKEDRIRLIADRRLKRYEAMWGFGGYTSRAIIFRINAGVAPSVRVTAFSDYWFGYAAGSDVVIDNNVEVKAGETKLITHSSALSTGSTIRICGTDQMEALDFSPIMTYLNATLTLTESYSAEGATHLRKLILADDEESHVNTTLDSLNGLNRLYALEELDVRRFSALSALDISSLSSLHILRAQGTSLTVFRPADSVVLTEVSLPNTIVDFALKNATVTTLSYTPTAALRSVSIEGTTGLDTSAFVSSWLDAATDLPSCSLTVDGVDWTCSADFLLRMAQIGTLSLRGKVTLTGKMTSSLYDSLKAAYGPNCFDQESTFYVVAGDIVTVEADKTTVSSGDTVTFRGISFPDTSQTVRYRLYQGVNRVEEDTSKGTATYNGAVLNCSTGVMTTTVKSTDFTLKVTAYTANGESDPVEVTITKTVLPTGITLNGSVDSQVGEYNFTVSVSPSDCTVPISSIAVTVEKNSGS